jgi:hypothetical protein
MDVLEKTTQAEIVLPESLLKKLSYNQKLIVEILAKNPAGMLSRYLSHKTGVSNKSDTIKFSVRQLLAKYGLAIHIERLPKEKQHRWSLLRITSTGEQS